MSSRVNGSGARRLRTIGVVISALAALISPAVLAAPAASADEITGYLCVEDDVTVCEAAGLQAGGSPQRAEQYLREQAIRKASLPPAMTSVQTGYLLNASPNNRRYYGWRMSRNLAQGERVKVFRCQLVNGRLVNCRHIGDIGVQAEYFLRNRYVSDMETKVVNLMAENFGIRHSAICTPPSAECIAQLGFFGSLFAEATSTADHMDFQLRTPGFYSIAFQWELDDPVTRTRALSGVRTSFTFKCGPYNPPTNPGDCFFEGGFPGGNH